MHISPETQLYSRIRWRAERNALAVPMTYTQSETGLHDLPECMQKCSEGRIEPACVAVQFDRTGQACYYLTETTDQFTAQVTNNLNYFEIISGSHVYILYFLFIFFTYKKKRYKNKDTF